MTNIMQMDLVTGVVAGAFGAFLLLHPDFVGTAMPFPVWDPSNDRRHMSNSRIPLI